MVVVKAGRRVPGPLAGHLLGLCGADVISIEPTGGDPLCGMPPLTGDYSARFFALHRGKRLVEADLWHPAGRRTVLNAMLGADVFLQSWVLGKAEQFDLGYHRRLASINPRPVSVHASGWGDALGAHPGPGTDFMVQVYAGPPDHLTPAGGAPAESLMTLLDVLDGLAATNCTFAGLLGHELDGRGWRVHSSLLCTTAPVASPAQRVGTLWAPRVRARSGCHYPPRR